MTKKCIAARKCYKARKAGVPARRKRRGAGTFGDMMYKANHTIRRKPRGSGLRKKRTRRGRGRGRGRKGRGRGRGAGFLEDLGKSFEWVGNAALTALPFIAAVL